MTDTTQHQNGRHHVPTTVADMLPPKTSSLITEAANFLRAHWDEVRPWFEILAGEKESKHGSQNLDEAATVFAIQELASQNGYAFLGSTKAATLRRALRFGYKRNTGTAMRVLVNQHKQRMIEDHRQPQT